MKKNIQHVWTVICQNSTVDQTTNNISLFNIVEEIQVDKPINMPVGNGLMAGLPIEIITFLKRTDFKETKLIEIDMKINLLSSKNKLLSTMTHRTAFKTENRRLRVIAKLNAIPIEESGEYNFVIQLKELNETNFSTLATVPLEIKLNIPSELINSK